VNTEFVELSVLLIMAVSVTIVTHSSFRWARDTRRHRILQNQFKLYAVRDSFVQLVASGRLSEDEWLFGTFYVSINRIVKRQHLLNFCEPGSCHAR
jgi:hypothetical protein